MRICSLTVAAEWSQPIGVGTGYTWRLYSIIRAMEVDRGDFIVLEAIKLNRDIQAAAAWLVNQTMNRVSRTALPTTPRQTREAVTR